MPLYLCRWPNGDCSFVLAPNQHVAIELLDEIGNADGCPLTPINDLMLHFRLSDTGEIEFEGFGEATEDIIFETGYPVLDEALLKAPRSDKGLITPEGEEMVRAAVAKERERVTTKRVEPETELGRAIQHQTDAPAQMIDRIIRKAARKRLMRFREHGKPQ